MIAGIQLSQDQQDFAVKAVTAIAGCELWQPSALMDQKDNRIRALGLELRDEGIRRRRSSANGQALHPRRRHEIAVPFKVMPMKPIVIGPNA